MHSKLTNPILIHFSPAEKKVLDTIQELMKDNGKSSSKTKIVRALVRLLASDTVVKSVIRELTIIG